MKYYEVLCKGGHVGRNRYIPITLYVYAETAKDAAQYARYLPRVKHNHKDCILNVQEVSKEKFLYGIQKNSEDPYMSAKNIQEQRAADGIYERTVEERKVEYIKEKEFSKYKGIRNLKKYSKMNQKFSYKEISLLMDSISYEGTIA